MKRSTTARPSPRRASPRRSGESPDPRERWLTWLSGVLLCVAFLTGGSSQINGWGLMLAELLALVVIVFVFVQPDWRERLAGARWALAVTGLVLAMLLLQLLPIPAWLWNVPPPRAALQNDLVAAGVTGIDHRWSLAPAATERNLLMLLPACALLVAALALPRRGWHALLWCFTGLVAFSVVLALAQLGAPQDSILNPYPQYVMAFTGIFANRNHQACAVAMALVLNLNLMFHARARALRGEASRTRMVVFAALVAAFAVVLPMVGSRAGVINAVIGGIATLLAWGAWPRWRWAGRRQRRMLAAMAAAVLAAVVIAVFLWLPMQVITDDLRWQMDVASTRAAIANMPLGAGFGSFARFFEQVTGGALMYHAYINATHNEYLQWWLAGGVLAVVAMVAAAGVLVSAAVRLARLPRDSRLRALGFAALLTLLVPILHSTVDYPLRTPALMTSFGMLAGIAVGAAARARQRLAGRTAAAPGGPLPLHSGGGRPR